MVHQCERPACAEPAAVAYGFDPARAMVWLEAFTPSGSWQGRLCRRHADAMVVPQGWWLEDRRASQQLFDPPAPAAAPTRRPWRPRRPVAEVIPLPLEPTAQPEAVAAAEAAARSDPAEPPAAEPAWTPRFVADDDLDGVLNATSPLLSRAFGRVKGSGTRQRPGA